MVAGSARKMDRTSAFDRLVHNGFFELNLDPTLIRERLLALEQGKVGFYSVGLYPAALAYNCAMQTDGSRLLLAPRPGRELLGAFPPAIWREWIRNTWPRWSKWLPICRAQAAFPTRSVI